MSLNNVGDPARTAPDTTFDPTLKVIPQVRSLTTSLIRSFDQEISSIPIRRRSANRSKVFSVSAHTRDTIAPTVRQAIRINSHTAVFEHATASQATVSSKA